MTLEKPLYDGKAGSPATILTEPYIAGTSTEIKLDSVSVMPAAPNLVTISKEDGTFVTVLYTGISGNSLTGLTPKDGAITGTFLAASTAARKYTYQDDKAVKDDLRNIETRVSTVEGNYVKNTDKATASELGIVKPDGTTITVNDGVLSAVSGSIVSDVKINGTSVVSSGVADIPVADSATTGVVSDTDYARFSGKQDALSFDTTPTTGSTNPVTSGGIKTALDGKEDTANKVTSFQVTPDNTHYPSEKLVKDNLDLKQDVSARVTSFQGTPDDVHYPSEKLVKDTLDGKANTDHSATHGYGGSDEITISESQVTNLVVDLAGKQKVITISTSEPTAAEGIDGDIWFVREA